eukprot:jgi/Pico_ML_1/54501/g4839.t1
MCEMLVQGIDFKLEEADLSNCDETILKETGFDGLSVRITRELVTLGPRAKVVNVSNTGQHVSPEEFHSILCHFEEKSTSGEKANAVLIDTRNIYESSIGRQISSRKSEELADLFCSKGRMIIRHDSGHLVPSNKLYKDQYVSFLSQFQAR